MVILQAPLVALRALAGLGQSYGQRLRLLTVVLAADGHVVVTATSAREALALVGRGEIEPRRREGEMASAPPPGMAKVLFANSGSEANDTAIKLAWYINNALGRPQKKKISILNTEQVEWIDYKDVNLLRRFMSERAKIRARRVTGNCVQHQRDIAIAVKNAREVALLPFTSAAR